MIVIRHEHIREQLPTVLINRFREEVQEETTINVIGVDRPPIDTSIRDVPQRTGILQPERTGHDEGSGAMQTEDRPRVGVAS